MDSRENKPRKEVKFSLRSFIKVGIFFLILIALIPFLLTRKAISSELNFLNSGQIGDTIGGTTAPFIGILTAFLTFLAFWVQYQFNQYQTEKIAEQDEKINQQDKAVKKDKFESRFYDLVKIHRANVEEITIKDLSKSRRAFISMFKEFRFCYFILENLNKEMNYNLSENEMINISFLTFMYGIGQSSNTIVNDIFNEIHPNVILKYVKKLKKAQDKWIEDWERIKNLESKKYKDYPKIETTHTNNKKIYLTTRYKPFDGHLSRLGHYYRHLYYTIKFIDEAEFGLFNKVEKENYAKTLRAQLSGHEQLLLYYNSLTVLGSPWNKGSYIKNYKLIKNIPLPLADFGNIALENYKSEQDQYFEWLKIKERLKYLNDKDLKL